MLEIPFGVFKNRLAAIGKSKICKHRTTSRAVQRTVRTHFGLPSPPLMHPPSVESPFAFRIRLPSFASREKLDCDYVTVISVVRIIRCGYTPMDNYELECGARRREDVIRSQE
jgi:hypothetical protein